MAGGASWTGDDMRFMQAALQQACRALEENEVPVGCVVVRDGAVVAAGSNKTNETRNGTRHAEFVAVDELLAAAGGDPAAARFHECHLYVTCEPCIMCAGALSLLRFGSVTYGCPNDKFGGNGSILCVNATACGSCSGAALDGPQRQDEQRDGLLPQAERHDEQQQHQSQEPGLPCGASRPPGAAYPSRGGLLVAQAVDLLQRFYTAGNPNAPVPHRPVRQRPTAAGVELSTGADAAAM